MRPRLLPTLAAASLACCVLLCALWARSCWWAYYLEASDGRTRVEALCNAGAFVVGLQFTDQANPLRFTLETFETAPYNFYDDTGARTVLGFGKAYKPSYGAVWFPLWFPTILALIPPLLWWRTRRRHEPPAFPVGVQAEGGGHPPSSLSSQTPRRLGQVTVSSRVHNS